MPGMKRKRLVRALFLVRGFRTGAYADMATIRIPGEYPWEARIRRSASLMADIISIETPLA